MQRILVIQTAFIGDVVLATGLLEKLHAHLPGAAIDILVRKGNESLFHQHPFIRQVLVWNKQVKKYRHLFGMVRQVRAQRYDTVINVQRYAATGLLTVLSGAKTTIGFNKNPFSFLFTRVIRHAFSGGKEMLHETARNHLLIASFTGEQPGKPKLYPADADYALVEPYKQQPYICIAPASVWYTKQLPAAQWAKLINTLPAGYHVYLLGAPGDRSVCDGIAAKVMKGQTTNLAGQLGYLASAALMKDAVMNYVNDSAPLHFASAMNAPVTAIYCSTIPAFGYGPLSDRRFIVEGAIPLACRPCGLHGKRACPEGHFNCARNITNEQLLNSLS